MSPTQKLILITRLFQPCLRVCIIEKNPVLGGAGINTGTVPSKALREAVLHLTGTNKRALFGENFRPKRDITIEDLTYVSQQVIHNELAVIDHPLLCEGAWERATAEITSRLLQPAS